jgi:branched-subunit amino acid transport protein
MSMTLQILAMAVGVYALRMTGLVLREVTIPVAWERGLRFVPVAMLTALVVTNVSGRDEGRMAGIVAALIAAVVARRTGRMWLCIVTGIVVYGVANRL